MIRLFTYALLVILSPFALAEETLDLIRAQVNTNKAAIRWAIEGRTAPSVSLGDLTGPGPTVTEAGITYDDNPGQIDYMFLTDLEPLDAAQVKELHLPQPIDPSSTYFGLEFSKPYLTKEPGYMSPGTAFRILRRDAQGRLFWIGNGEFEIVRVSELTKTLRDFNHVGPIGGPVGGIHSNADVLVNWGRTKPDLNVYRALAPAVKSPKCPEALAPAKSTGFFGRLFGRG